MDEEDLADFVTTNDDGIKLELAFSLEQEWHLSVTPADMEFAAARKRSPDEHFDAPQSRIIAYGKNGIDRVVTFPTTLRGASANFLNPKYRQLQSITFDGFGFDRVSNIGSLIGQFESLPKGCNRNPFYGLGMRSDLHTFVSTAFRGDISKLTVVHGYGFDGVGKLSIEGDRIVLPERLFDRIRRGVDRIHNHALGVATDEKRVMIHNAILHAFDPITYPEMRVRYRKDAIVQVVGDPRRAALSSSDQSAVVTAATLSVRPLARKEPAALLKLSQEIEVVTLEQLVERIRKMMEKNSKESTWQTFLIENSFVLKIAFGIPIALVGGQQSVGGQHFSGSGTKISDIVIKAAASGNVTLVEIKTPNTPLLEKTPYRGDLYSPSRELSGAVNQVLDQRYQLQKSITNLKDSSGEWELESYAIQGLVIAGQMPTERAQLKSVELFRNGLREAARFVWTDFRAS